MNTPEISIELTGQSIFDKLKINLDAVPIEYLAEYTAVQYYLTIHDEPPLGASELQKMHRYAEAVHHLTNARDKKRAQLLITEIPGLAKYLD